METVGSRGKTSEKIADIARTSRVQVDRLRRVKREAPEKYAEVIDGKKSIRKAYDELPPIRKRKSPTVGYWSKMPNSYPCSPQQHPTVTNSNLLQESAMPNSTPTWVTVFLWINSGLLKNT
ncbi:hypothetical protein [Enterococcus asini]|uniref:hypothetical protein n=1 Tax=Enterococcus asini TaxID=57732 RepID=UPI0028934204|nr:hypothetical protein [Enterococcus asini]